MAGFFAQAEEPCLNDIHVIDKGISNELKNFFDTDDSSSHPYPDCLSKFRIGVLTTAQIASPAPLPCPIQCTGIIYRSSVA
jgi:hypothetical protein